MQRIKTLRFIHEEPIGNVIEALVRIYDDVIDNAFLNLGVSPEHEEDPAEVFQRRITAAVKH